MTGKFAAEFAVKHAAENGAETRKSPAAFRRGRVRIPAQGRGKIKKLWL
jgi:hypothetical protein